MHAWQRLDEAAAAARTGDLPRAPLYRQGRTANGATQFLPSGEECHLTPYALEPDSKQPATLAIDATCGYVLVVRQRLGKPRLLRAGLWCGLGGFDHRGYERFIAEEGELREPISPATAALLVRALAPAF